VKEGSHFEDLGVHSMHLAQNRDKWQAVVDTLMKTRVPPNARNCSGWIKKLQASEEGLCSTRLIS
jgi:hypothetical protein